MRPLGAVILLAYALHLVIVIYIHVIHVSTRNNVIHVIRHVCLLGLRLAYALHLVARSARCAHRPQVQGPVYTCMRGQG